MLHFLREFEMGGGGAVTAHEPLDLTPLNLKTRAAQTPEVQLFFQGLGVGFGVCGYRWSHPRAGPVSLWELIMEALGRCPSLS